MSKLLSAQTGYLEERIKHEPHGLHPNRYTPVVATLKESGVGSTRDFEHVDMNRVIDYDRNDLISKMTDGANGTTSTTKTRAAVVADEVVLLGDFEGDGTMGITFPKVFVVLRGCYLFCFNPDEIVQELRSTTYNAAPICVIPIRDVDVQFPAGGRRVFREHAHTDAQTGYEFILLHQSTDDPSLQRPPAFLVVDSLSKRNRWKDAILARACIDKPTLLRAGYGMNNASAVTASAQQVTSSAETNAAASKDDNNSSSVRNQNDAMLNMASATEDTAKSKKVSGSVTAATLKAFKRGMTGTTAGGATNRESRSLEQKVLEVSHNSELASAVLEFGDAEYDEEGWVHNYYKTRPAHEAEMTCQQMEDWSQEMKKSLKGAVLEQYEYFVQASGEMTTMGQEVASLKQRIELQTDMLKHMKEIDFSGGIRADAAAAMAAKQKDELMDASDSDTENSDDAARKDNAANTMIDELGDIMDKHRGYNRQNATAGRGKRGANGAGATAEEIAPPIDVPDWLQLSDGGVVEEISGMTKECRYSAAIELHNRAVAEIADLLDKHERPTAYRLTKRQLDDIFALRRGLKKRGDVICHRLEESLRRKNEALRQMGKRDRSDNHNAGGGTGSSAATSASLLLVVSPCALNDDGLYLQLLAKLGRTQEASDAFAGRRSLLLFETLQEKPMSGAGTIDLVIYAAQLSQSFFSCLASSVEGFLDLFLLATPTSSTATGSTTTGSTMMTNGSSSNINNSAEADSDASSLHSNSMVGDVTKNLPAGAVASLVLWCDSELSKFAMAFGGSRILANLALSPAIAGVTDGSSSERTGNSFGNSGSNGPRVIGEGDTGKDRTNAIEVAAQCIDQAFLYASQNLDSVGLPLTPRLAGMIRTRLKGCECEVSNLLDDRWQTLTQDWRK